MSENEEKSGSFVRLSLWFIITITVLLAAVCFIRLMRDTGCDTSCKNNLRELIKLTQEYQDKFKHGPPREDTFLRGSCHLKALLYGPMVAGVWDEKTGVLKISKLFQCSSDDIPPQSLSEMRALAPEEFCLYCSYVVADKNLRNPAGDHVLLADDAQDKTGAVYLGNSPQDEFRGYPPFRYPGGNRAFCSHSQGGNNSFGDGSVDFAAGAGLEVPKNSECAT